MDVTSLLSKEENGSSVRLHLISVIQKIVEEQPDFPLNDFENLSIAVKEKLQIGNSKFLLKEQSENSKALFELTENLLIKYGKKEPKPTKQNDDEEQEAEPEEEEEAEPIDMSKVANIFQNQQILQWAGVHFGMYFVCLSVCVCVSQCTACRCGV